MDIALIPARGGSRRIPHKNRKLFHGKPIICYSIEAAQQSGLFRDIYVSTDDEEISAIALAAGAKVIGRSKGMFADEVGTQTVAKDFIEITQLHFDLCVIYPTCPLMIADDLVKADRIQTKYAATYCMSVGAEPLRDAGQFYYGSYQAFLYDEPLIGPDTAMLVIPESRVCDINTPEDWARAEQMYANLKGIK